ncbi:hypothetical protein L1887_37958 [Cichorium endivia]|nr:hypothetical protein L1887_37958 [Cichorium endivia]
MVHVAGRFHRFGMLEIELNDVTLSEANLLIDNFKCANSCSLVVNGGGFHVEWKGIPIFSVSAPQNSYWELRAYKGSGKGKKSRRKQEVAIQSVEDEAGGNRCHQQLRFDLQTGYGRTRKNNLANLETLAKKKDLKVELALLRVVKVTGGAPNKLSKIKVVRTSIAQVLTVISQTQKAKLRKAYKNKKYLPLDLRPKKTKAICFDRGKYVVLGITSTTGDNLAFLEKWFEKISEYKNTNFYITGESYAG